jgi:chromosome partitioning protein
MNHNHKGKTICLYNIKGGEAKTTTAFNLAAAMAAQKQKILLVDVDAQATLTVKCGHGLFSLKHTVYAALLGEKPLQDVICPTTLGPDVSLAPSDLNLAAAEREIFSGNPSWGHALERILTPVRDQYDYVLIDCPGASLVLTTNAIIASHVILCPMQCADLSLHVYPIVERDIMLLAKHRGVNIPIYVVRTLMDNSAHAQESSAAIEEALGDQVLPTVLKRRTAMRDAMAANQSILQFSPGSDIASAHRQLAKEVMDRV